MLVRRIVADVVAEYARVLDLQEILEFAEENASAERYEEIRTELIRAAARLRACVEELENVGVELRDWSLGVVDFPCVTGGRQVCLSWQHGDDRIRHWHEQDTDLAGLRPIHTLPSDGRYAPAGPTTSTPRPFRDAAGMGLPQKPL